MKKITIIFMILFTLLQAKDLDTVGVMHGMSTVGSGSAISVVVASGLVGVAVIATPAIVSSLKSSNKVEKKELEISKETVTSYNYKNNKEVK